MPSAQSYVPLSTDSYEQEGNIDDTHTSTNRVSLGYYLVVLIQTILIVILILAAANRPVDTSSEDPRQVIAYSPAAEAAINRAVTFNLSPNNPSRYQDTPSVQVDEIWRELYKVGISSITPAEQENLLLVGVDAEKVAQRSDRLIQLAVFHDMHCVNKLRQRLREDYYTEPSLLLGTFHMDHCIDALRQTVMCAGDITPIVWRWDYVSGKVKRDASTVHECRDFDKVKQWALERVPDVNK